MILSGLEIKNRIGKDIGIDPYNENQINPNKSKYNLTNIPQNPTKSHKIPQNIMEEIKI